jgi:heme A synthase
MVQEIHRLLSSMIGLYSLLMGLWGVFLFIRRRPPDASYNGALAIGVGMFVFEGVIGVVLVAMGLQPARWIHVLYGVTIALTIPAIFAFTRGKNSSRESMFYGLGMLFIWGLSERAATTAVSAP